MKRSSMTVAPIISDRFRSQLLLLLHLPSRVRAFSKVPRGGQQSRASSLRHGAYVTGERG